MSKALFNRNYEAAEIRTLFKSAINNYLEIGRRLLECKRNIPHGEWEGWLAKEFNCSARTARRYIRVSRKLDGHLPRVADYNLSLRQIETSVSRKKKDVEVKEVVKPEIISPVKSEKSSSDRLEFLESMQSEYEFVLSSYKRVRGLIMEQDPEYWHEIVRIIGKKNLYLG